MPTTLQQQRADETRREAAQTSERQSSEASRRPEEGLYELIGDAQGQVRADESRIVRSVNMRLSDTMGVDPEKADWVLKRYGFAGRIKSAKEKINLLAKTTQEKIAALTGPSAEARPQKKSGETEAGTDEDPRALTLDTYMARYHAGGGETVRDKVRSVQFQLRGIKDPERVLGLVHYLEDKAVGYKHETIIVNDSEKEREKEKYEAQGYDVFFSEREGEKGKARMNISKDVPYRFEMHYARGIADLTRSANDPVQVLERLREMGYKMSEFDFGHDSSKLKKFLDDPRILPLLEKIATVKGVAAFQRDYGVFDYGGEGEQLLKLAELDDESHLLDGPTLENLRAVGKIIGHPVSIRSVEAWVNLKGDPGTMELLVAARDLGKAKFSKGDDVDLARGLEAFKEAGISADVAALAAEGFDPRGFSLENIHYYTTADFVKRIAPTVKELASDPALREFVLKAFHALNIQPTVDAEAFERIRAYYQYPGILPVLKVWGRFEAVTAQNLRRHEFDPGEFLSNKAAVEAMGKPDFLDFIENLKKGGCNVTFSKLFPHRDGVSEIYRAYDDEFFRTNIGKEENILLANKLRIFMNENWELENFDRLMKTPDALRDLEVFEQRYNYHCGDARYESESFAWLLNSEEGKFVLGPEMESPALALRELGYQLKHTSFSGDVAMLVELGGDKSFCEKISDPQISGFIKSIGNIDLSTIRALADCDVSFHAVIEALIKEFNFWPNSENLSKNIPEFTVLRDDPRILEVAGRLYGVGVRYLNPITNLKELKGIVDNNLFDIIKKCRNFPSIQQLILDKPELFSGAPSEKISDYFTAFLEKIEGEPVRANQMIRGELIGVLLKEGKYDTLEEMADREQEHPAEVKRMVEKIKNFVESYKIGGKGHTIATLLSMREYRQDESFSALLARVERHVEAYQELLDRYSPHNIPPGLRASIGMEYEITKSTAEAYYQSTGGSELRTDMQSVSQFAKVGSGRDAVFEIATKPSDNPRLILLEMQLLQDLEFIDLNFKEPGGYERGARGYHVTIGGEYGVNVGDNSNFLQNALVMSGWGGINAGKEVQNLSKGRSMNIRQRNVYESQKVFDNARPAVEFRALSLDTWEPFERAMETSYYGAIAVQAFEKYVANVNSRNIGQLAAESPEEFYELLRQKSFINEETNDPRVKQIIFAWAKLQLGFIADVKDHDENFLQNELYGYEDERGEWIDANEHGGASNRERFIGMAGSEESLKGYAKRTHIDPEELFKSATPELANKLTTITNLFVKASGESGGDVVNAASALDTTKIGRTVEVGDPQAKYRSFFDTHGKTREGYYYVQGGSEKMIIHKAQMRLLAFNKSMQRIVD